MSDWRDLIIACLLSEPLRCLRTTWRGQKKKKIIFLTFYAPSSVGGRRIFTALQCPSLVRHALGRRLRRMSKYGNRSISYPSGRHARGRIFLVSCSRPFSSFRCAHGPAATVCTGRTRVFGFRKYLTGCRNKNDCTARRSRSPCSRDATGEERDAFVKNNT